MSNNIKRAFDDVHAEESLKQSTKAFLSQKIHEKSPADFRAKYVAVLAGMFLFLVGIGSYFSYFTQVATISVDINPSIEIGINLFNKVVSVKEFNEDAALVLESVDIKHKNYTDAIDMLMTSESFSTYLKKDALITFTVVSTVEAKDEEILSTVQNKKDIQNENVHCYKANQADIQAAHESGLSVGKYRAYLELLSCDPTVQIDEIIGLTMRQIQDKIDACTLGGEQVDTESNHEQGTGKGNSSNSSHGKQIGKDRETNSNNGNQTGKSKENSSNSDGKQSGKNKENSNNHGVQNGKGKNHKH